MPLSECKPDALAFAYARALFDLVEAEGGRARVEETLGELEEIVELARSESGFGEFLASRILPEGARAGSLRRVFEGRVSPATLRFLLVLNRKGRLAHLPAIVAAFDALAQERFGRVEVDLYTAAPIDAEQLREIRQRLARALGKDVVVHPYTDGSMIGGVRLRIGDRLIDGSIATRLRRLRERLTTEGLARLRVRMDRIIENGGSGGTTDGFR